MHKGGWKPFWAALGAALLVLLPLCLLYTSDAADEL